MFRPIAFGPPNAQPRFGYYPPRPENDKQKGSEDSASLKRTSTQDSVRLKREQPGRVIHKSENGLSSLTFRPVSAEGRTAVAKVLKAIIRDLGRRGGLIANYTVDERDKKSPYKLTLRLPGFNDKLEVRLPGTGMVPVKADNAEKSPMLKFFAALKLASTIVYQVVEGDDPTDPLADADKWINDALLRLIPATHAYQDP